jgi:serine/threonine-protein kinase
MGSVWEGRHSTLGTRVAIKFIEAEYANSQDARSRFDNEARAAATIQSKHAIQIYDHGVTDDGRPYIVMEMLIGEPLEKRIERLHHLPLQDTARILQQVSRALARAHEKGIIHRDLKPENIFLVKSDDEDDEIAKVLDFGIAKIKANPGEMGISSSTKTGAVLGTPFYMSPEQARGLRTIDHRTDIWSLGVIAFKCATGKLPFDGESVGDLLVKICTSPVPVPSHVMPGLPPGFDAWFSRAMEREPERRFGSVQEMSDALAYAAGITMRQPGSGPGGPMLMQGGMQGATLVQSGMQRPSAYPQGGPGNPGANLGNLGTGPQPALSGTQSPFTTSAHAAVPMKSNKGPIFASIGLVALIGVGAVVGVTMVNKRKAAAADTAAIDSALAARSGAGLVANGGQPQVDTTKLPDKLPDPIPAVSVDTTAANARLKPAGGLAGGNTIPPGPAVSPAGAGKPGGKGKPVASAASPTTPTPPTPATPATPPPGPTNALPPGPAVAPPGHTPPPPPKGKVDESGF